MRQILKLAFAASFLLTLAACGGGKQDKGALGQKKADLEKLKADQKKLADKISKLQDEIDKLDPAAANANAKLVSTTPVGQGAFDHYIDLQGKVDAYNVAYIAPRGQGGFVKAIYVKQGDYVRKGQTILKLDAAVLSQSLAAAQQQLSGVKAQLDQSKSIYERQQNLWKQNIGTEIQVLNAKTNMEALQSQYNAAQANIRLAQEQLNTTNVVSEIDGTVNILNVKVGEFFSGGQQIQVVNNSDLKLTVNVPENYADRVKLGSTLVATLPESDNETITTKVNVAGKVIDPITRSFYVEGKIPSDKKLRANQLAMIRIMDYSKPDAITIPMNTLQTDDKGKFVLVATEEGGKLIARKKQVEIGELYGDKLEIRSGLNVGDRLITQGFQSVYDGQRITENAQSVGSQEKAAAQQ
ncbi:efflux RND transporter periplasmic adaptor subunit [Taibaiella helva]|uniref:efflux RND transporter periplasmic adaptor subunit n=1 Tax=Taibaiella helva TaxID=2301235 RepID=UPI000E58C468|nr:efflux RND transporter periplasmic adaptor subunit [Taibaiella helva]